MSGNDSVMLTSDHQPRPTHLILLINELVLRIVGEDQLEEGEVVGGGGPVEGETFVLDDASRSERGGLQLSMQERVGKRL